MQEHGYGKECNESHPERALRLPYSAGHGHRAGPVYGVCGGLPRGHPGGELRAVAGLPRQRRHAPLLDPGRAGHGGARLGRHVDHRHRLYSRALLRSAGNARPGALPTGLRGGAIHLRRLGP